MKKYEYKYYKYKAKYINLQKGGEDEDEDEPEGGDEYGIDGFNASGFNKAGFDRNGFNKAGFDKAGFNAYGFNASGFDRDGFDRDGFDASGFNINGFNKDGLNKNETLHDSNGYNSKGFNIYLFHKNGSLYDDLGYDSNGYNANGFNKDGLNKNGTLYDDNGFDIYNVHRNGTYYNNEGYDYKGFDINGFNIFDMHSNGTYYDNNGFNKYGFNKLHINKNKRYYDDAGYNYEGFNKYGEFIDYRYPDVIQVIEPMEGEPTEGEPSERIMNYTHSTYLKKRITYAGGVKFDANKPTVLITLGPPGSGKTDLVEKTLHLLNYTTRLKSPVEIGPVSNNGFVYFLIDDRVATHPEYIEKINQIIKEYNCEDKDGEGKDGEGKDGEEKKTCDLKNPTGDFLDRMSSSYLDVRKKKRGIADGISKSLDDIMDDDIKQALSEHKNIVFETTGMTFPIWLLKSIPKDTYNIVFSYSFVEINKLIKRLQDRNESSFKNYFITHRPSVPSVPSVPSASNPNKNIIGPRVIDLSKIEKKANITKKILLQIRKNCFNENKTNTLKDMCHDIDNKSNHILLIFDNNKTHSTLIYDNRTHDQKINTEEFVKLFERFNIH